MQQKRQQQQQQQQCDSGVHLCAHKSYYGGRELKLQAIENRQLVFILQNVYNCRGNCRRGSANLDAKKITETTKPVKIVN